MYAVIKTGGKQYKVSEGDILFIEKLEKEADEIVSFDEILAIGGDSLKVGTPIVSGAKVEGKVIKQGRGKKLTVFTYMPKTGRKRKVGHRQSYTKVEITSIKG